MHALFFRTYWYPLYAYARRRRRSGDIRYERRTKAMFMNLGHETEYAEGDGNARGG